MIIFILTFHKNVCYLLNVVVDLYNKEKIEQLNKVNQDSTCKYKIDNNSDSNLQIESKIFNPESKEFKNNNAEQVHSVQKSKKHHLKTKGNEKNIKNESNRTPENSNLNEAKIYQSSDTEYKPSRQEHDEVLYKNYSDCEANHQPLDLGKDLSLNNINALTKNSYCRCSKNYIEIINSLQDRNSKINSENLELKKEINFLKQQSKILGNMCKIYNNNKAGIKEHQNSNINMNNNYTEEINAGQNQAFPFQHMENSNLTNNMNNITAGLGQVINFSNFKRELYLQLEKMDHMSITRTE